VVMSDILVKDVCLKIKQELKKKSVDKTVLNDLKYQLNCTVLETNKIPYYKSDLLACMNRKRLQTESTKGTMKLAWIIFKKTYVVIVCEVSLVVNSLITIVQQPDGTGTLIVLIIFFLAFAMFYFKMIHYLEMKKKTFFECLKYDLYMVFFGIERILFAGGLITLLIPLFSVTFVSQPLKYLFVSIVVPFFGVMGSFITNVVYYNDAVCSLNQFVKINKNTYKGELKFNYIYEEAFVCQCLGYYKNTSDLDRDLWKYVVVPLSILKKEIKMYDVPPQDTYKIMNNCVYIYDTDRPEPVKESATLK